MTNNKTEELKNVAYNHKLNGILAQFVGYLAVINNGLDLFNIVRGMRPLESLPDYAAGLGCGLVAIFIGKDLKKCAGRLENLETRISE